MADTVNNFPITEAYKLMYTANVQAALSRRGGLLMPYVSQATYSGEKAQIVNFIGPIFFKKRTSAYADTIATEPEHTSRWITADDWDCAILIDRIDTLRTIYEPTNPYVERMREALARTQDDIIAQAFFADARSGKTGSTAVPFPPGDIIAAGGVGLTFAKLRALRKAMKRRFLNLGTGSAGGVGMQGAEKPLIAVTAEQTDNLLGETVVGSHDYNMVKPLVDGEVSSFMGFTFIPAEGALSVENGLLTGGNRLCPAWVPSGMHFGDWQSFILTINQRADKNNIPQIHGCFTAGATRVEEGRVFQVLCADANAT